VKTGMIETLYKTKTPEEVTVEQAEYYELVLDAKNKGDNRLIYFVRELHGWWDDDKKRNVNSWQTYGPEEGYTSFDEAFQRYQVQREARAKNGFVHSFSPEPDYYTGNVKVTYQHIKV
jgi:hypothetical protein